MPNSSAFFILPVGLALESATSNVVTFLEIPPATVPPAFPILAASTSSRKPVKTNT